MSRSEGEKGGSFWSSMWRSPRFFCGTTKWQKILKDKFLCGCGMKENTSLGNKTSKCLCHFIGDLERRSFCLVVCFSVCWLQIQVQNLWQFSQLTSYFFFTCINSFHSSNLILKISSANPLLSLWKSLLDHIPILFTTHSSLHSTDFFYCQVVKQVRRAPIQVCGILLYLWLLLYERPTISLCPEESVTRWSGLSVIFFSIDIC